METQRPWVPCHQSFMWSMAAQAALAAEDLPRASMMALPRCCTVLRNAPLSHSWSVMTSVSLWPLIVAWVKSGYIVGE